MNDKKTIKDVNALDASDDIKELLKSLIRDYNGSFHVTRDAESKSRPMWIFNVSTKSGDMQIAVPINKKKTSVYLKQFNVNKVDISQDVSRLGSVEKIYHDRHAPSGKRPASFLLNEKISPKLIPNTDDKLMLVNLPPGIWPKVLALTFDANTTTPSFTSKKTGRTYKHGSKRTWELVVDAITYLGGQASAKDVRKWITSHVTDYSAANLHQDLNMLSVNYLSRGQFSQNGKPRRSDQQNEVDRLYKIGSGPTASYAIYSIETHGIWELYATNTRALKVRNISQRSVDAELEEERNKVANTDAFDASDEKDARRRALANIVRRQGQPEFRRALMFAYESRCSMTGCSVVEVLEAAHITPYRGKHTNVIENGLLLRADIHTLYDLDLISVNPKKMEIEVSKRLAGTEYARLNGKKLTLPRESYQSPNALALVLRYESYLKIE